MISVSYLRNLVEMGLTHGNIKKLKSVVGEKEFERLSSLWKDLCNENPTPLISSDLCVRAYQTKLAEFEGQMELKICAALEGYEACPYNPEKLIGKDISINKIGQVLKEFKENVKKLYVNKKPESALESSKTLEKLFSPKFRPTRHVNEDGYFVTTIIDKQTGNPVEAYVKKTLSMKYFFNKDIERWDIFVKRGKDYERVGKREFIIDKKSKEIGSSWMEGEGHDRYAGIGIRAHQIGVERMLQEGFKTVEIKSEPQAFPFHYKTGFRTIPETQDWTNQEKFLMDTCCEETGLPFEKVKEILNLVQKDGKTLLDTRNLEKLRKISYLENNGKLLNGLSHMSLEGEHLNKWIEMAKSQPIIM